MIKGETESNDSQVDKQDNRDKTLELTASGTELSADWKRAIALVWSGQAISLVTSGAAGWAVIWYLTVMTSSPMVLALASIAYFVPVALLGPLAGALVDRHNRKHIMIAADLGIAVVTVAMALVIIAGLINVPLMLVMLALRSVGTTFHQPAMQAAMPLMVPERHLVRIGSLDQGIMGLSNMAAPAIGVFFYETMGLQFAMFADAAGALVACVALVLTTIPDVHLTKARQTGILREMGDGLRAIRSCTGMGTFFVLVTLCVIAFMPMASFFPLMTYQHFGGDGYAAAIVEAVFSAGFVAGSGVLLVWGGGRRLVPLIVASVAACGAITAVCGLLPVDWYWGFVALSGLMAVTGAFFNSPLLTVIQKNIPPEQLGRVMAVFGALTSFAGPVGLVIGGPFAEAVGVPMLFIASGIGMVAVAVASLFFPQIHRLDKSSAAEKKLVRASTGAQDGSVGGDSITD
ncbi:MAG: MFS transporter [Coriobacteriales bacterium]|nr:MFS transporter [Coriobacteriales bacterium]